MSDAANVEERGGVQVIARCAAILRALSEHSAGLSLGGIAKAVGLPRSTVQRIVNALEAEQFVESVGTGGGTRLGPAML
jgi:DNA-binding IclR family transcriptional regulator